MNDASKNRLAILAYVIPILGPIYLLFFTKRDNYFLIYHARQMLALALMVVVMPVLWAVVAYPISWIPVAGPMVSVSLFGLVILTWIAAAVIWAVGLVQAIGNRLKPLPLVWQLSERIFSSTPVS
jgi:uncharacterized membrane protein